MTKLDCLLLGLFLLLLSPRVNAQPDGSAVWQWSVPVRGGKTNKDARAWLWVPSSCNKIRAVVVAQSNMEELSILEDAGFRSAMGRLGVAEVWVSPMFDHQFRWTEGAGEVFDGMMKELAAVSGYSELEYSPVVGVGHSAAASWPYYFAAWAPERTLACISVSGQWPYFRDPRFAAEIWAKGQNIDFIPSLETQGEYEAAQSWATEGLKERSEHPAMPLSMLACPAEGHFAATKKKIDYIALYIKKAMEYRLGDSAGRPKLRRIDPRTTGWLMGRWVRVGTEGRAGATGVEARVGSVGAAEVAGLTASAPVAKYKGDRAAAFWFFDEEMVRATERYESEWKGRKAPLLGYVQGDSVVRQKNTHLQVELKWNPLADGVSFVLKGTYLDTVPGESPRPAMWTGLAAGAPVGHPREIKVNIDRVDGPFRKVNDTLFRLTLEKEISVVPRKPYKLTFIATSEGDGEYQPAAQQAEMIVPNMEGDGVIHFAPIPDQAAGVSSVELKAWSELGKPVYFYVISGPAVVSGDMLKIVGAAEVRVMAWSPGARSVEQRFFIGDRVQKVIGLAERQYEDYIKSRGDSVRYPRSVKDGALVETSAADWTSGFFPGCLWQLYRFTGKAAWKAAAERWTAGLESQKDNKGTHDLGFMLYDSYGLGYAIAGEPSYKDVLLAGARSLSTRYHPEVGAIRSWDNPAFHYPVIIDNLMNLEYLFWATRVSGDPSYYKMAVAHAETDLKYRFRPDNSSYHVLDFDPATGRLLRQMTHQGYSDSSCWARGQAWGIYGYTVLYRETKDKRYLEQATRAADYFIDQTDRIPDHIPYWDFQAPDIPDAPRDASAAAVAASGMIELSRYAGRKYFEKAAEMLGSLCSDEYLARPGTNNYFLLKHSTGHWPHHSEIDVPIVYADYYFLEALWRYREANGEDGVNRVAGVKGEKAYGVRVRGGDHGAGEVIGGGGTKTVVVRGNDHGPVEVFRRTVHSPDGRIGMTMYQKDSAGKKRLYYTVSYDGRPVVLESALDICMDNHLMESALALKPDTTMDWCADLDFMGVDVAGRDTVWRPLYGENATVRDHYNEITIHFSKASRPQYSMRMIGRVYNEGVAFRYYFPENPTGVYYHITEEHTEFAFPAETKAWHTSWAQGAYKLLPLNSWPDESERPLSLQLPGGVYVSLAEAQMTDYARTKFKLSNEKPNTIITSLFGAVDGITYFGTPWRVVLIGEQPGDLIRNKDLLLNLNPPSSLTGTDWIRPGKIMREMTLTTPGAKEAIDFAAAHHLQYILFDWKWYGPAMTFNTDATKVVAPIDMAAVVAYGKRKGVGVWLYVNQQSLLTQLDTLLPLYERWGIKGIKFGFVELGSQRWTVWLEEAIKKAAAHHLMVNVHDEWRPTGEERTWPNLLTAEGIRGNEEMPDATHNTVLPFTRCLAGPADYTICYYDHRIKTTHAHQLALAAVYYSPLLTLFWYDRPAAYHGEPEVEFFEKIPVSWDESRVLGGRPGEYVAMARRSGEDWYVGVITNDSARKTEVAFDFLPKGRKYKAVVYSDDADVSTMTHVRREERVVDASDRLTTMLKPSGGVAIWLTPVIN